MAARKPNHLLTFALALMIAAPAMLSAGEHSAQAGPFDGIRAPKVRNIHGKKNSDDEDSNKKKKKKKKQPRRSRPAKTPRRSPTVHKDPRVHTTRPTRPQKTPRRSQTYHNDTSGLQRNDGSLSHSSTNGSVGIGRNGGGLSHSSSHPRPTKQPRRDQHQQPPAQHNPPTHKQPRRPQAPGHVPHTPHPDPRLPHPQPPVHQPPVHPQPPVHQPSHNDHNGHGPGNVDHRPPQRDHNPGHDRRPPAPHPDPRVPHNPPAQRDQPGRVGRGDHDRDHGYDHDHDHGYDHDHDHGYDHDHDHGYDHDHDRYGRDDYGNDRYGNDGYGNNGYGNGGYDNGYGNDYRRHHRRTGVGSTASGSVQQQASPQTGGSIGDPYVTLGVGLAGLNAAELDSQTMSGTDFNLGVGTKGQLFSGELGIQGGGYQPTATQRSVSLYGLSGDFRLQPRLGMFEPYALIGVGVHGLSDSNAEFASVGASLRLGLGADIRVQDVGFSARYLHSAYSFDDPNASNADGTFSATNDQFGVNLLIYF